MAGSTRSGSYGSSCALTIRVDADDLALAGVDLARDPVGRPLDLGLLEALLDRGDGAAELGHLGHQLPACASMSSVIDSIAYEPASGSTVAVRSVSQASTCCVRSASVAAFWLGSAIASS